MNYMERRRICREYYKACRKGRREKRRSSLLKFLSKRDENENQA